MRTERSEAAVTLTPTDVITWQCCGSAGLLPSRRFDVHLGESTAAARLNMCCRVVGLKLPIAQGPPAWVRCLCNCDPQINRRLASPVGS